MDSDRYSIHFSPLQGYTDRIYRNAFAHYFGGVEVYYTPFIRVEKGALRKRDLRDIEPETNTVADLIPQILPGSADEFRLLTDTVHEMAKDEARHGKGFEGLYNRYFKK